MTMCKKCGARKRSWFRSCSQCRSGSGRTEAAGDAADLAVAGGAFEWAWRGVRAVVRLVVRALN
ncbi:hypothetical protein [Streptomyces geranii]|uniref:hypothetical protein n=1 Tax=Streptomyces geranii TaxID=2058923 RepID=UPI000D044FE4|nr:hypothetical protein [Streptomyces geranii]